jgi:hypothetical protein
MFMNIPMAHYSIDKVIKFTGKDNSAISKIMYERITQTAQAEC